MFVKRSSCDKEATVHLLSWRDARIGPTRDQSTLGGRDTIACIERVLGQIDDRCFTFVSRADSCGCDKFVVGIGIGRVPWLEEHVQLSARECSENIIAHATPSASSPRAR